MSRFGAAWEQVSPRLRLIALIDVFALASAAVLVAAVYVVRHEEIRSFVVVLLVTTGVLIGGLALTPYLGEPGIAYTLLSAALVFSFGSALTTPFLSPLSVLVLLIPLIVVYPFLGRRGLAVTVGIVTVAVTGVSALAESRRVMGADLPLRIPTLLLAMPIVVVVIVFVIRQNYRELHGQAEQLRESRTQVAQVADAARRSLERDLHDGAQQRLVGMSVLISLVRALIDRGDLDDATQALEDLGEQNLLAINELRDLARGIYPQLLAERGLAAALAAVARRSTIPATVLAGSLERQSPEVESAVYFCILEALQNAAKHSGADQVEIRVHAQPHLEFTVVDTGRGFDPATVLPDGGLLGMEVRVRAAGGELRVESAPGRGTTVRGVFPEAEDRSLAR